MNKREQQDYRLPETAAQEQSDADLGYGEPLDLTTKKKNPLAKIVVLLGALAAMGMVVGGIMNFGKGNTEEKPPQEMLDNKTGGKNFKSDQDEILEGLQDVAASDTAIASGAEDYSDRKTEDFEEKGQSAASEPPEDPIRKRKLEGEIMKTANGTDEDGQSSLPEKQSADVSASPDDAYGSITPESLQPANNGNALAERLQGGEYASRSAQRQSNTDYLLSRGTAIPCVLTTKIVTTFPGLTRCQVTRDVYSANGKTLLIERGSSIIGEQTSALIQGQARVFAQWSDLRTPSGVIVKLDSLGADPLGASGHPARVKTHFWKRFGGAILISMIGDLGNYAANRRSNGSGQTFNFESTSEAAQDMATEALKNSINIPPTGYINQGTQITVFVARDVDFSGVYETIRLTLPYQNLPLRARKIRQ